MTDSPYKTEPRNDEARQRIEQMITDKMAEIRKGIVEELEEGLELAELARNSIHTSPLEVIEGHLREASAKFDFNTNQDSREFNRLANVVKEIREIEEEG